MTAGGGHRVIRNIPRSSARLLEGLAAAGVATTHEALGRRGFIGTDIRPIQRGVAVAGNAVTVSCHPGDNMMIHAAVEVCQENDILVVTNTGPSQHGMFGDLLATSLVGRGVRGLVIDAGVRDVAAIRAMRFPVWSRYVSPLGTEKANPGSVNVPVTIGDVTIAPGDVVCADDDGVVIVPHRDAADCLRATEERLAREETKRASLASGALTLDIDGIRDKLVELGVEFVDTPPAQRE
ncbi:MAG: 4-carboxy-4-hydroxy-2-oxoadipate aldolase/oxaloacetate decarboxylase [Acidimicrobiia bacterium]|jgi:4-hydroxy-4-methyl-2-oxoglutarate aldolase